MIKTVILDQNYSIELFDSLEGRSICLINKGHGFNESRLLALYNQGKNKWDFTTEDFWRWVKLFPSQFKNNIFKPIEDPNLVSFNKRFKCFKRRTNISVTRSLNRLKND